MGMPTRSRGRSLQDMGVGFLGRNSVEDMGIVIRGTVQSFRIHPRRVSLNPGPR